MNDNIEQKELFFSVPPADDAAVPGGDTLPFADDAANSGETRPPEPPPMAENPVPPPSSSSFIIDDDEDEAEAAREAKKPMFSHARRTAPAVSSRPTHHHPVPETAGDAASAVEFGARVRALRLKSGLSLEDVAAETLIKKDYLLALETGDFEALPASVYVTAYLRRVCRLYGADTAESDALVLQLHDHLSYEIPDIAAKVHDLETDEREQRKVRQIFFGIIAAAVLFVIIVVVAAALLFTGRGRSRSTAPFDESALLRLQPRAELKISILPARAPGR